MPRQRIGTPEKNRGRSEDVGHAEPIRLQGCKALQDRLPTPGDAQSFWGLWLSIEDTDLPSGNLMGFNGI
jgi:hypothetical protein